MLKIRTKYFAIIFLIPVILASSLNFSLFAEVKASSPNILISEVYYDTPGTDSIEEWIELYNPTDQTIDLIGWSLSDNYGTFDLPSASMPSHSYLIIARDDNGFFNLFNEHPNISGMTLNLGNSGDIVTLKDNNSAIIDQVSYEGYTSGWDISASTGKSIARKSIIDTDTASDWLSNQDPTPFYGLESDTTSPQVSFIQPINGVNLTGTVYIQVNASDDSAITTYEIYINGTLVSNQSSYKWDTTFYEDGRYNITAIVSDEFGNKGNSTVFVYVVNSIFHSELFKLMTYNVEASGANPDWMTVVEEENPDILVCIETGKWDDNNEEIFRANVSRLNSYWESIGEEPYNWTWVDHTSYYPTQGYAIMSRYEIVNVYDLNYVTLDNGSLYYFDFVHAEIKIHNLIVNLIAVHLKAFAGEEFEAKREAQMEGVINYMDNKIAQGDPIILVGDFNSFSPEDTGDLAPSGDLGTGPVSELIEPGNPHGSLHHNFTDVFRTLNPNDPGYTYGHQNPSYKSRIDFIFVNEFFTRNMLVNSTVGDTPHADTGSDHYPVDVFINLIQGIDVYPPSPVRSFTVTEVTYNSVTLSWLRNIDPDLKLYMIFRNSTFLVNVTGETYRDTGLEENTTYVYDIYAVDYSGNVSNKSTVIVTTAFMMIPNAPENLGADVNGFSVSLYWDPPSNQTNRPVAFYRIYRSNSSGGPYALIGNTTVTTFDDRSIFTAGDYFYVVKAVNEKGESGPSAEIKVSIVLTTSTNPSNSTDTSNNETTPSSTSSTLPPTQSQDNGLTFFEIGGGVFSALFVVMIAVYWVKFRKK